MRMARMKARWWRLAALVTGTTFFLNGCDPSIKTTVEDGVISLANSFLTALLQAMLQAGTGAAQGTA